MPPIAPYVEAPLLCTAPSRALLCITPFKNRPLFTGGDTLWRVMRVVPSQHDSLLCIAHIAPNSPIYPSPVYAPNGVSPHIDLTCVCPPLTVPFQLEAIHLGVAPCIDWGKVHLGVAPSVHWGW